MSRGRLVTLIVLVVAVVAIVAVCNRDSDPPTTTGLTTTTAGVTTTSADPTTTAPGSTTTVAPTTSVSADQTVTVLLSPFSEMGPEWTEQIFPYGEGEEFLGTSPGGDGLMLGPEYGTQTPDGSWWFLDAASLRIAHFAADGSYLDQVVMPEDLLVDGLYFQYQMPQGLDDGSITAGGFPSEDTMSLLRIADGQATGATFEGAVPLVTTDGALLYGLGNDGAPHALDPSQPVLDPVDWLRARDGSPFMVTVNGDEIVLELPDAGLTRRLQMRYSEDPEVVAHGAIEVETGADGTIFLVVYGIPESDETLGIGGFVSVSPDGQVGQMEPIGRPVQPVRPRKPITSGSDPGHVDALDHGGLGRRGARLHQGRLATAGITPDLVHRFRQCRHPPRTDDVEGEPPDQGEMGGRCILDHLHPEIGQPGLGAPAIDLARGALDPPLFLHSSHGMRKPAWRETHFGGELTHPEGPRRRAMKPAQYLIVVVAHPRLVPELAIEGVEHRSRATCQS